jgi:AcrR family transcriptional regulator
MNDLSDKDVYWWRPLDDTELDTRGQILFAAYKEIHVNGFQSASLSNILKRTGVTKGALYHHFRDKSELGYAVVDEVIDTRIQQSFIHPLLIQNAGETFSMTDIELGCPLSVLAQEMAPIDEGFRTRLTRIYQQWHTSIAAVLARGKAEGLIIDEVEPETMAVTIVALMEGSLSAAKVAQSLDMLYRCGQGRESIMVKKYAEFILGHRWIIVILAVSWIMAMGAGAQHLTFTNDYRVFFGKDNPQLMAFENLQDTYAKNDNVMLVLVPADGEVFTRETLGAVAWLTERAWETPYSTRVESLSNYQHTSAIEDDLLVEDLAYEPQNLTDDDLLRIRDIALNEPVLVNRLISPRADVTGINITIELPGVDPIVENPEVVTYVRQLRSEFRQAFPEIDVKLTGIIMMNQAFPEASQYDMTTLFPLMLLLFVVVLFFWVRGFSGTVTTFCIIVFSIIPSPLSASSSFRLSGPWVWPAGSVSR